MIERRVTLQVKPVQWVDGTSRYAEALAAALGGLGWQVEVRSARPAWPHALSALVRRRGIDLDSFGASYPLLPLRAETRLLHLTGQTLATSIALTRPSRPVVVTVHDILPLTLRDEASLNTLRHPADRACYALATRGLARADLILADSRYTADELTRATSVRPERIVVVPLGVDSAIFHQTPRARDVARRHGLADGERYAVYVGSEDPRKNLGSLLGAVARLAARHPDLLLVKVGPAHHGDERAHLERLAAELRISERVRFLAHVPNAELASIYASAAACVVPSLFEGFGLPVLEAMACGVPVICSNRTSLPEVAGDAALVVEPTSEALAAAIQQVLADDALARQLVARGLERAAQFSWRRTAERTIDAYERVLGEFQPH